MAICKAESCSSHNGCLLGIFLAQKSQQFIACLPNQMLVVFSIYKVLFSNLGLLVPIAHMPAPNFTKFATIINFFIYSLPG